KTVGFRHRLRRAVQCSVRAEVDLVVSLHVGAQPRPEGGSDTKRREFLGAVAALPAVPTATLDAQRRPPVQDPVEQMTAPNWPTIALNHLGFRPRVGQKVLVVRALATPRPVQFTLRDVSERPFHFTGPLNGVASASDFGPCLVAEFPDPVRYGLS